MYDDPEWDWEKADRSYLREELAEVLRPFLVKTLTPEVVRDARDALVKHCSGFSDVPYIEIDAGELWKNEVAFDLEWSDGETLELKLHPGKV